MGNDHILATKRYDRGGPIDGPTVIPCRDPTSGIRHGIDLGDSMAPFKRYPAGARSGRAQRPRFCKRKQAGRLYWAPLNSALEELDTELLNAQIPGSAKRASDVVQRALYPCCSTEDFPPRSLVRDIRAPLSEALELSECPTRLDGDESRGSGAI